MRWFTIVGLAASIATALLVFRALDHDEPEPVVRQAAVEDYDAAPLRTCGSRTENGRKQRGPSAEDVRIGQGYFQGAAVLASQPSESLPPNVQVRIKVALVLPAGTRATLVLSKAGRGHAALAYAKPPRLRPPFTIANGGLAVRFGACAASQKARTYEGNLGRWALYPGSSC